MGRHLGRERDSKDIVEGLTVEWVIVVPLISLAVDEYQDIRKIVIIVDYMADEEGSD